MICIERITLLVRWVGKSKDDDISKIEITATIKFEFHKDNKA
jgi:hypothetical protein